MWLNIRSFIKCKYSLFIQSFVYLFIKSFYSISLWGVFFLERGGGRGGGMNPPPKEKRKEIELTAGRILLMLLVTEEELTLEGRKLFELGCFRAPARFRRSFCTQTLRKVLNRGSESVEALVGSKLSAEALFIHRMIGSLTIDNACKDRAPNCVSTRFFAYRKSCETVPLSRRSPWFRWPLPFYKYRNFYHHLRARAIQFPCLLRGGGVLKIICFKFQEPQTAGVQFQHINRGTIACA